MSPLGTLYGRMAALRRGWYARRPQARHRLRNPVISIGNLTVGGSGKTPVAFALAEMLRHAGERPAILSRGYRRRRRDRGVIVVSDGESVLEGTERSGDEPQLLARTLTGVPVLVSTSRYEAGQVAESRFGCTVLLLDDGFQHLTLARDVDLLLMALPDLEDRVLPFGRLREPLASARYADALLVPGTAGDAARMSAALGVIPAFTVETRYLPPARVTPYGEPIDLPAGTRVVAVAGIARPHRFFSALRDHGWQVTQEIVFPDHHWFRERDLRRAAAEARRSRADLILTTEKDAVRLDGRPTDVTWAYLPMRAAVEPAGEFAAWIAGRLAAARRKAT